MLSWENSGNNVLGGFFLQSVSNMQAHIGQIKTAEVIIIPQYLYCAVQSQKAVPAHLKSEQLLPFGFARHITGSAIRGISRKRKRPEVDDHIFWLKKNKHVKKPERASGNRVHGGGLDPIYATGIIILWQQLFWGFGRLFPEACVFARVCSSMRKTPTQRRFVDGSTSTTLIQRRTDVVAAWSAWSMIHWIYG